MKYSVEIAVLGSVPKIEISEKQYRDFETAHTILRNALGIEEKYEVLISNYAEFEKQILNTASEYMIRRNIDYSDFFGVRLGINIRLVNLLTSARLYVDQIKHQVAQCMPAKNGVKEDVERLFNEEYDASFEYRFMEALRNYVQHKGLPVHFTSQGSTCVETEDGFGIAYSSDVATMKSCLESDGSFKKSVLREIDNRVDLKVTTRHYVEILSSVHDAIRRMIEPSIRDARRLIDEVRNQYRQLYEGSLVGLCARAWDDKKVSATIPLILDWDDVRVELTRRNKKLTNLSKRYVTSNIKTHS